VTGVQTCALPIYNLFKNIIPTLFLILRHFYIEGMNKIFFSKRYFISIHGPDGVGKTTFINHFKSQFSELVSPQSKIFVFHFRPYLIPNLKRLLYGKKFKESDEDFLNPHRALPSGYFLSIIRMVYYFVDFFIGYHLKIKRLIRNGDIVIFDRYFQDIIVDSKRARIKLPNWFKELLYGFVPKPGISFYLFTNSNIVFSRKQELNIIEIERQLKYYKLLANKYNNSFLVDTTGSNESCVNDSLGKWLTLK
jgi:thymidylate kinase